MERLFESELRVMEPLWEEGELSAGALAKKLNASCGWNRNTTYTVIKKLVDTGAIERKDPGFKDGLHVGVPLRGADGGRGEGPPGACGKAQVTLWDS